MHTGTIIYMRNVPGTDNLRALTAPLYVKNYDGSDGYVPFDFEWNGHSTPIGLRWLFPRHNHPIGSCRHDWRCQNARSKAERAWADKEFETDVGTTSWWITKKVGYVGVRIGAFLGIGCGNFGNEQTQQQF